MNLRKEIIRDVLARASVPGKDIDSLAANDVDDTAAVTAVRELLDSNRRTQALLVLAGPRGVGKTTAAGFAIAERMRRKLEKIEADALAAGSDPERALQRYRHRLYRERERWGWCGPMFVTAHRLSRTSRYDSETWEALETAPLLVVDDLGVEFLDGGGNLAGLIDGLLNERYADRWRTVITTNLALSHFEQRYGERVVDRLREAGRYFACTGSSLRGSG